jgi:hypothetical protein
MAKKKKEGKHEKLINWIMLVSILAMLIGLGFLKNYSWLQKQNTKPFGYVEKTLK